MKTKLYILQEVDKVKGFSRLIGAFNFIEDAIEQIAEINSVFEHSKFEIYETFLGTGISVQVKTVTRQSATVDIIY